jgi:hypothetical protein
MKRRDQCRHPLPAWVGEERRTRFIPTAHKINRRAIDASSASKPPTIHKVMSNNNNNNDDDNNNNSGNNSMGPTKDSRFARRYSEDETHADRDNSSIGNSGNQADGNGSHQSNSNNSGVTYNIFGLSSFPYESHELYNVVQQRSHQSLTPQGRREVLFAIIQEALNIISDDDLEMMDESMDGDLEVQ